MPIYFLDSSALVKRYISETGSAWVSSIIDPVASNSIHIVRISGAEVVSAIARRAHDGSISPADAAAALTLFRHHFLNQYTIAEVSSALIDSAMQIGETHCLRGYDSVQLAGALEVSLDSTALGLGSLTLISADAGLNEAATAEALIVDDPNTHP